jgi:hypothetical protein
VSRLIVEGEVRATAPTAGIDAECYRIGVHAEFREAALKEMERLRGEIAGLKALNEELQVALLRTIG